MNNRVMMLTTVMFCIVGSTLVAQTPVPGVLQLRPGMTSDRAHALMRGAYTVCDSVGTSYTGMAIRMVPVRVGELDGLLVLHVDSSGTLTSFVWSRNDGGRYAPSEAMNRYTGFSSWKVPTTDEFRRTAAWVEAALGKGREVLLAPVADDGETLEPMPLFSWERDGSYLELWLREGIVEWRTTFRPMGW